MIRFQDVSLRFGDLCLFEHLDFRPASGEVTCLLGPSGCGKTTMLNLIAGLVRPDSGQVTTSGRVAYVFQDSLLLPWETVAGNASYAMGGRRTDRKERTARTAAMLDALDLTGAAGKRPPEISGGMARRTALARALLAPHDILLLDEPFAALDPDLRDRLVDRVAPMLEGKTVVLVTHDYKTAAALSRHVYSLSLPPVTFSAVDQDHLRVTLEVIRRIDSSKSVTD